MTKHAEDGYRAAWSQYCLNPTRELEKIMDALQSQIATGPSDPRWNAFISTLPGYEAFWGRWYADVMKIADAMEARLHENEPEA